MWCKPAFAVMVRGTKTRVAQAFLSLEDRLPLLNCAQRAQVKLPYSKNPVGIQMVSLIRFRNSTPDKPMAGLRTRLFGGSRPCFQPKGVHSTHQEPTVWQTVDSSSHARAARLGNIAGDGSGSYQLGKSDCHGTLTATTQRQGSRREDTSTSLEMRLECPAFLHLLVNCTE